MLPQSRLIAVALTVTLLGGISPVAWGQCHTNQARLWICRGSSAWQDGYLLPPNLADECVRNAEAVSQIPAMQKTRDDAIQQRDTALQAIDQLKTALEGQNKTIGGLQADRERLASRVGELSGRMPVWQVVVWASLAAAAGAGSGYLVGRLIP